jgi:hypothetical protein
MDANTTTASTTPSARGIKPAPAPGVVLRDGKILHAGPAARKARRPRRKPDTFRMSANHQHLVLRLPLVEARITALVREQTLKCLAAAVAAGVSQNRFCRRLGLAPSRAMAWRQAYAERGLAGLEPEPKGRPSRHRRGERALVLAQLWIP